MKISNRDWVQLSAYLDGELSQRDLTRFENRIKKHPALQAALEDFKDVKTVLSHTPQLAVPRNFTLDPSLVQKKSRQARTPFPVYRMAAAALSVLFVGVVVLDLGSVVMKGGLSASQAPMAEEIMLEAAADAEAQPEMMAVEEAESDTMEGGPGIGGASPTPEFEEAVEEESVLAAEMEEAPLAPESDLPAGSGGGSDGEGESDAKVNGEDEERTLGEAEDTVQEESQNALDEEADFGPEETQISEEPEIIQLEQPPQIPWLRVLEIVFGLGAIGFGIAAWRRRQ